MGECPADLTLAAFTVGTKCEVSNWPKSAVIANCCPWKWQSVIIAYRFLPRWRERLEKHLERVWIAGVATSAK